MQNKSIDYEQITYPNFVHPQTHPNRLATMARAYGLQTAPVENCRVLELGCGSGINLLAMASNLRASQFVGVDLSTSHIKFGTEAAAEIGATNIKLICADLMEVDFSEFEKFDYVIAHGLYSWVPAQVREKILEVVRENLCQTGVAFVSYNAFPGCHLRLMMREMMKYHTEKIESPSEKISHSLALLNFLRRAAFDKEIYAKILEREYEGTAERVSEVIIHDDLANLNQPFYFHEFIAEANTYDLQFLSEAEYFHEKYTSFNRDAVELLDQFGDQDIVRREQYLDFLNDRRFRQTLLCHKNVDLKREVSESFFNDLQIACDLRSESEFPDFGPQKNLKFSRAGKDGLTIDHPLTKAAFFYLCELFPQLISLDHLVEKAKEILKHHSVNPDVSKIDLEILKDILLKSFSSEVVSFFMHEPQVASEVGEKPKTDEFVRWQAKNSDTVLSRRFRATRIKDEFIRNLIMLCDGEHTRDQMISDFAEKISDGRLSVADESVKEKMIETLPEALEDQLRRTAKLGLFVS